MLASSSFSLESFRYRALAVAGDRQESQDQGRRISADWVCGLGEPVLSVEVIPSLDREEPATLVCLTRQSLTDRNLTLLTPSDYNVTEIKQSNILE